MSYETKDRLTKMEAKIDGLEKRLELLITRLEDRLHEFIKAFEREHGTDDGLIWWLR